VGFAFRHWQKRLFCFQKTEFLSFFKKSELENYQKIVEKKKKGLDFFDSM